MSKIAIFLLLFFSLSGSCYAGYYGTEVPGIDAVGEIVSSRLGSVEIKKRSINGAWQGDTYNLVIEKGPDNQTIVWPFQSDYGQFHAYVCKLTDGEYPEIVLVTARGKGTSVTSYYMDIYEIAGTKLIKTYEKKISEYFGPQKIWWYDIGFDHANSDFDFITLTLSIYDSTYGVFNSNLDDWKLIPRERNLKIYWNDVAKKYSEVEIQANTGRNN